MELEKVLVKRMSTRKYNDRMPSDEDIQKVIDAALLGPIVRSHKLHLSVVTNKDVMNMAEELTEKIVQGRMPRPYLYGAPVWIILSGKKYDEGEDPIGRVMNNNLYWNIGSLIENMELQATELGLASCGINTTIVSMNTSEEVRKAVGIPEGYDALASVILGYNDDERPDREIKPELIPVTYIR